MDYLFKAEEPSDKKSIKKKKKSKTNINKKSSLYSESFSN